MDDITGAEAREYLEKLKEVRSNNGKFNMV
jgi:hypothetical protein